MTKYIPKPKPKAKRARYRGPSSADIAHQKELVRNRLLALDLRVSFLEKKLEELSKALRGSHGYFPEGNND